jgi:hypothetical protein
MNENKTTKLSEENTTPLCRVGGVSSRYLTVKQLNNACKKHPYILARFASGYQMGINSKVAPIAQKRKKYDDNELTEFVSFLPCDINTYITHKHPFM